MVMVEALTTDTPEPTEVPPATEPPTPEPTATPEPAFADRNGYIAIGAAAAAALGLIVAPAGVLRKRAR